jgi:thioredoxin 1
MLNKVNGTMKATDENLEQIVNTHKILLVDFWAEWCRPCKVFSPILDEISQETSVWVAKINVDENPMSTEKYNITSMPTTLIFDSGVHVKTIVGAKPKHIMMAEIKEWL